MTTVQNISTLPIEDVRSASAKLAKTLAKRIIVGVIVSVTVTIIANALVAMIENHDEN